MRLALHARHAGRVCRRNDVGSITIAAANHALPNYIRCCLPLPNYIRCCLQSFHSFASKHILYALFLSSITAANHFLPLLPNTPFTLYSFLYLLPLRTRPVVDLHFFNFHTEKDFDFVSIYTGVPTEDNEGAAEYVGLWSGTKPEDTPHFVRVDGTQAFVDFFTDGQNEEVQRGFSVRVVFACSGDPPPPPLDPVGSAGGTFLCSLSSLMCAVVSTSALYVFLSTFTPLSYVFILSHFHAVTCFFSHSHSVLCVKASSTLRLFLLIHQRRPSKRA
jgi:hypothetical protein